MASNNCSSRFTWLRIVLLLLFVAVNVALYKQSNVIFQKFLPFTQKFLPITQKFLPPSPKNASVVVHDAVDNSGVENHVTSLVNHTKLSQSNQTNQSDYGRTVKIDNGPTVKVPTFTKTMDPPDVSTVKGKIVNPHDFSYVLRPKPYCKGKTVEVVICVPISRTNFDGRQTIRDTWGRYAYTPSNHAVLVFFIGSASETQDLDGNVQRQLKEEARTFGDILQESYVDSYSNLSLKSVSILKWVVKNCQQAEFIIKADDDMYVNIPFAMKILRETAMAPNAPSAFVMGSKQIGAVAVRDKASKWYTSIAAYSGHKYPDYVSGTTYVVSRKAAPLLYETSLRVPLFWLEDIYITGLCAKNASVPVLHSNYFSYGKPKASGCTFRTMVSGHRFTQAEIRRIHAELYNPQLKCS